MMTCHPDKIKKLPQYKDFVAKIKEIDDSKLTEYRRIKAKKKIEEEYNIFIIPLYCDYRCPYKKICDEELKRMWAKILLNDINAVAFNKTVERINMAR